MSETEIPKPLITEHGKNEPGGSARAEGRIARRFRELSGRGELGIVAYLTAGDPTIAASERIILAAAEAGADVIELGVPFSDPVADGPTIQRASERALRGGATLAGVLDLARRLRARTEVPLVLFSYYNPILQMGLEKFAQAAAEAGIDGVLATDMTPEESLEYRGILQAQGLDTIFLGAPTSTDQRLAAIAECSGGFLYLISRTGVTGARESLPEELPALVKRARKFTKLPIAVGFGISQPEHVAGLAGIADAAVVGSALVAEVEKAAKADSTGEMAAEAVARRIRLLKAASRDGSACSRK
jgi:tryptophan synthase alpha chain